MPPLFYLAGQEKIGPQAMRKWMALFMANDIFIDISGLYALLIQGDNSHEQAKRILFAAKKQKRGLVTTDYVLDEIATLL